MDAGGSKKAPSLPPGYVSLAMLQQRWMQMQKEKNLKGEMEEEKRGVRSTEGNQSERVLKNKQAERTGGGSPRDPRVEVGEGLIEVNEKGKEVSMVGFDSGDGNKKKKKKPKKKKHFNKRDEKRGSGGEVEEVEIVGEELKGVQGTEIVSRNGVGDQIPTARGRRVRRNGGNNLGHRGGKMHRVKLDDGMKESGVELDLGKNQKEGGRMITKKEDDSVDVFKEGILEVTNGIRDLNNGFRGQKVNGRGKVQEDTVDSVALEKMGCDEHEAIGAGRDETHENRGTRRGFGRYGNGSWRGDVGRRFQGSAVGDWEAGNARSRMEWNGGYGRGYRGSRMERNAGNGRGYKGYENGNMPRLVWVKKEERPGDAAAENAPLGKRL